MRFIFDTINLVEDSLVYVYDERNLIDVIKLKAMSQKVSEYQMFHNFKHLSLKFDCVNAQVKYNETIEIEDSDYLRNTIFSFVDNQAPKKEIYKDTWTDSVNNENKPLLPFKLFDAAGTEDILGFYNVYETQIEQMPVGLTELYVQLVCVDGLNSTVLKIVASKVDDKLLKNNLSQKFVRTQSIDIVRSHFEKRIKPVSRNIAVTFMAVLVFWMLDLLLFKSSTLIKCIVTVVGAIYFIWNLLDWSNLNGAYKILSENDVVHMENMDEIFTYVPPEEIEENTDSLEYKEEHWEQIAQKYSDSFKMKEGDN